MQVRMLRTEMGAEDGIHAEQHIEGEVYDLGPVLSEIYLAEGYAEPVKAPPAAPERAPKVSAPKNAAEDGPKRRKKSA